MGILPLQFKEGMTRNTLNLKGTEMISVSGLNHAMKPAEDIIVTIQREDGSKEDITLKSRIDTQNEIEYYRNSGILQYLLKNILKQ